MEAENGMTHKETNEANRAVRKYIDAVKDLENVRKNGLASFMDIVVREDRMENAKGYAIITLGEKALKKIMEDVK